jgi:hypothetical protein
MGQEHTSFENTQEEDMSARIKAYQVSHDDFMKEFKYPSLSEQPAWLDMPLLQELSQE